MSLINYYPEMKGIVNQQNILENSMLFKLELADGTSQLLQIPKLDVCNIAMPVESEPKTNQVPPITANVNKQVQSATNPKISSDKLHEDGKTSHFVYKIIKPEDLNLKPSVKTHLTRGRPRKRHNKQNSEISSTDAMEVTQTKKVIKQARTRSGRITKPPKHIEKDFKKIDISDDGKHETDLKTYEFEPLRTNETPSEEPLQFLQQHTKKRNIPSRFRCPTCNKAYLGRTKMINHFQKHPEHRTATTRKLIHHTTWNFLVLTSQKHKYGSKGVKFCEELEVLVQNARYLAHYLFKPVDTGEKDGKEAGYFINETLACLFGITPGKYNIDETELNRDVTLYEYLENNEVPSEIVDGNKGENAVAGDKTDNFDTFAYIINDNQSNRKEDENKKNDIGLGTIDLLETQSNNPSMEFSITNPHHDLIINKADLKSNCPATSFIAPQNPNTSVSNTNCLALVKYQMQPNKTNFIFNNHDFIGTNQLGNLTDYNNLEIKNKSVFTIENHKPVATTVQHIVEKQHSHMTLQNELRDVDDLMLVNVDTGQVSNILDTSSNSDDIMNVDQFVNERFKKLTEPDMDIQNNLLNLELPPLDMFNFHTS